MLRSLRIVIRDLAFSIRTLRQNVGFTATALATLAVGLGTTVAVFTVVNGVLFRPLPYADPSRIQMIWLTSTRAALGNEIPLSTGFFADIDANKKSFSSVAAFRAWSPPLSDGGKSHLVAAATVSPSLFTLLGVRPALGRDFAETDAQVGAAPVAIIGHALWRTRFGGDASIVGKHVDLENRTFTIVGVMPRDFAFPRGAELPGYAQFGPHTDLWAPLVIGPTDRQEYRALNIFAIGRLARGVKPAQARAELAAILVNSLKGQKRNNPLEYDLIDMQSQAGRHVRGPLLFLMSAVLLVLFIACANVTNLLVARTGARRREFAVRAALGAGRARIAQQLITENLVLGVVGAMLGVAASIALTRAMLALVPGSLPRADDVSVDLRVLGGAAAIALVIGAALGVASALQVRWKSLATTLRDAGARATVQRAVVAGRGLLVVAEISLAVMLVIGSLLLTTSFVRLQHVEPGFDRADVITAGVVLPISSRGIGGAEKAAAAQFYSQLVQRLSQTAGVKGAAAVSSLPLTSSANRSGVRVVGDPPPQPGKVPLAEFSIVEGEYFRTMGIKVIAGRELSSTDLPTSAPVIAVNKEFERTYLGGRALGKQLLTPFDATNGTVPRTIVGVVDDVSSSTLDESARPQVYLAEQQLAASGLVVAIRTAGDPNAVLPILEREVASLEPRAAVGDVQTLDAIVRTSMARQRFSMTVMTVFAASALFLTVVGLYGVITLNVGQRRREMGVRMALGARGRDVLGLVLSEGVRITSIGVVVGLIGAFALHRFVSSMLFGVSSTSATVFVAAAFSVASIALVATYVPALRASRVDPAVVLRTE